MSKRATPKACRSCGQTFDGQGGAYRYCGVCRVSRAEANLRYQRERRARTVASREPIPCQRCGVLLEGRRHNAKYCGPCRTVRDAENLKSRSRAYEIRSIRLCPVCNESPVSRGGAQCSSCRNKARIGIFAGEKNKNWKGGKSHTRGYVTVTAARAGKKSRHHLEHVVIWEQANGLLPQGWVIHHLNGVKDDNRLENLAGMPRNLHHSYPRRALEPYEARIRFLEEQLTQKE